MRKNSNDLERAYIVCCKYNPSTLNLSDQSKNVVLKVGIILGRFFMTKAPQHPF